MNKIAELVKEAEVRGVLAALVDGGHLKVASQEEFDALTEVVSASIDGYDHDLNTVLSKTAEVIEYLENGDFEKEAGEEEFDETAVMAAFGELSMMKMAGEIDDYTFEKEANKLKGLMDAGRRAFESVKSRVSGAGTRAKEFGGKVKDVASAKKTRETYNSIKDDSTMSKAQKLKALLNKDLAKTVALHGAGAAGTAVGGKALYDKYKK